jgi:NAD(P)H dehydrogenase (quinone)
MRVLIVLAHHEPTSFSHAMTDAARVALQKVGHEVTVSDLYAMRFDPTSDRRNFLHAHNPDRLKQQAEEEHASAHQSYVADLQIEMDKLAACDVLIFQFPLWWLGLPAILKGWVDRVFAVGRAYGGGRYFDRGVFRGRRAMCALTVGGSTPDVYSEVGIYGSMESILLPIHRGIFDFAGFSVVEPFVVYGPARLSQEERLEYLARYRERIVNIQTAPTLPGRPLVDYEGMVLKSATRLSAKY